MTLQRWTDEMLDNLASSSTELRESVTELRESVTELRKGFVDVQDVAKAILLLLNSDISGERFILSNEFCSYKELLTNTALAFGKNPPVRQAPSWVMNVLWRVEAIKAMFSKDEPLLTKETVSTAKTTTRYDTSKITRALPAMSFTPLSETIQRTSAWMRNYYSLDG